MGNALGGASTQVRITQSRMPDTVIGLAIGIYVVREAMGIARWPPKAACKP